MFPFKKSPGYAPARPQAPAAPVSKGAQDAVVAALTQKIAEAEAQIAQLTAQQKAPPAAAPVSFAIPPVPLSQAAQDAIEQRKAHELQAAMDAQKAAAAKFAQEHSPLVQVRQMLEEAREKQRKARERNDFTFSRVLQKEIDSLLVDHHRLAGLSQSEMVKAMVIGKLTL